MYGTQEKRMSRLKNFGLTSRKLSLALRNFSHYELTTEMFWAKKNFLHQESFSRKFLFSYENAKSFLRQEFRFSVYLLLEFEVAKIRV